MKLSEFLTENHFVPLGLRDRCARIGRAFWPLLLAKAYGPWHSSVATRLHRPLHAHQFAPLMKYLG